MNAKYRSGFALSCQLVAIASMFAIAAGLGVRSGVLAAETATADQKKENVLGGRQKRKQRRREKQ